MSLWHTPCYCASVMKAQPNVLVIDEDKNILAAFRISLSGEGFRPILCSNVADALRKASRREIDMVVTEIQLENSLESGFAMVTELRHAQPNLPIIVMSNRLDAEIEKRLRSLEIYTFFSKPLELRSLKRKMQSLLIFRGTHSHEGSKAMRGPKK